MMKCQRSNAEKDKLKKVKKNQNQPDKLGKIIKMHKMILLSTYKSDWHQC